MSPRSFGWWLAAVSCGLGSACNVLLGLDELEVRDAAPDAGPDLVIVPCERHADCSQLGDEHVCIQARGQCAALSSADCAVVAGPAEHERALYIGALFATSGTQAQTNRARQQSAQLAIEEIDRAGGLPAAKPAADHGGADERRPLVLVACDAEANLERAGRHLIDTLAVPAIIGPNTSQDTLELAMGRAIERGTLLISPTAVASSIADLLDEDLSWLMVPNDAQRAPLILEQVGELERALQAERGPRELKLAIVFRDDALGEGTRASLSALEWGAAPLSAPANLNRRVRIVPYGATASARAEIARGLAVFEPDVLVLIGTAEAVTEVMAPLERAWPAEAAPPHYVLTDSSRVPELLELTQGDAALRARIRGVGIKPAPESLRVQAQFERRYQRRFGEPAGISGMGPAYDSAYALAYAIAALPAREPTGRSIAAGLRRLATGAMDFDVGPAQLDAAFGQLATARSLRARGTFGPLQWDAQGSVLGGTIEVWCVAVGPSAAGPTSFASAGPSLDLATGQRTGVYVGCEGADPTDGPVVVAPPVGATPTEPEPGSEPPEPPAAAAGEPDARPAAPPSAAGAGAPPPPEPLPDAGPPQPVDPGFVVRYRAGNPDPRDAAIEPQLLLENLRVQDGLSLGELRLRYYFSNEHASACPRECVVDVLWSGLHPSGDRLPLLASHEQLDGSAAYLEVSFLPFAPTLEVGEAAEIHLQFHTEPHRDFDETDDYSFHPRRDYTEWSRVAVYRDDALIWGAPPPP